MNNNKKFYINGEWVDPISPKTLDVINPANEEMVSQISLGSEEDVNKAVAAAKKAFLTFSLTSREERLELFEKIMTVYKKRMPDLAKAITSEMGAPVNLANNAQAPAGLGHLSKAYKALKEYKFETEINTTIIRKEPVGVCGLITPWNWPINQIALKVIPAFATGCTMVLKPSEIAPLSAMLFAEMIHEAGFPAGVFNLVNGNGEGVGSQISSHPDINMVSFTGSTRAGKLISKNASETIKRVCLELGGKGGNIIFRDAYPDAVRDGVRNIMSNSGQSCDAPTRMLVEKSIYDRAVIEAADEANKIKVDIASKTGDHIGPVINKVQFDKIQSLIQSGIDEGATLVAGGVGRPSEFSKGYFVKPTVFTDVKNNMRIAQEEIFGPVLSIISFETEEEAIAITNDSPYGLGNFLQTENKEKARRVAKQLRAGVVQINGNTPSSGTPFGGYSQSGNGREGGVWGLYEYLEVKVISGWK